MCSGIWPPSNPAIETPVRDFWPFTPRPAVLPLPEPGPRPTRMRFLVDPGRGESSLSLVIAFSLEISRRNTVPTRRRWVPPRPARPGGRSVGRDDGLFGHHLHEVVHLGDHAADRGGVLVRGGAADAVQAQ